MVWIKRILITLLILIALLAAGVVATGNGPMVRMVFAITTGAPALPFDPADQPGPSPDYANEENWAALPTLDDLADLVPEGAVNQYAQGDSPVDVFFVHPTGFLKGSSWTFSMDANTSTEENTQWMMANQASPYNGCCNVYAPRYRQASMFAYMRADEATRDEILGFAYRDVARAFEYYMQHYNNGRPFVLASHSQGTHHSVGLLKEHINGTPAAEQFVAAFLIGGYASRSEFEGLEGIGFCDSPTQLSCIVHWDTYSEAVKADQEANDVLCVNPLTWRLDGPHAGKENHEGALGSSGEYHAEFSGDDAARNVEFKPLGTPLPNYVEAECSGGRLYISDQSETAFGDKGAMGDTYHGLDYPMFYMDIRENAILRVNTYLQQNAVAPDVDIGHASENPVENNTPKGE
jgi:Protein of unknown function (DUF3089)